MKKTQLDYAQEIALIKAQLEHNSSEKLERQLNDRIKKWLSFCEFEVHVANNETTPWTDKELGLKIKPMETKKDTGLYQTGDYVTYLVTEHSKQPLGLLVERKTIEDLYQTLMNSNNRSRFYREIQRFHEDPRFNQMIIMVEGTRDDFLRYVPDVYIVTIGTIPGIGISRLNEYFKRYYKMNFNHIFLLPSGDIMCKNNLHNHNAVIYLFEDKTAHLYIDGILRDKLKIKTKYGKHCLYQSKGSTNESKIGTLASVLMRGVHIEWAGSRQEATKQFKYLIDQWCIKNYEKVIR